MDNCINEDEYRHGSNIGGVLKLGPSQKVFKNKNLNRERAGGGQGGDKRGPGSGRRGDRERDREWAGRGTGGGREWAGIGEGRSRPTPLTPPELLLYYAFLVQVFLLK